MLQNTRVADFTGSELFRENQLGGKVISPSPTQIGVNIQCQLLNNICVFLMKEKNTKKHKKPFDFNQKLVETSF